MFVTKIIPFVALLFLTSCAEKQADITVKQNQVMPDVHVLNETDALKELESTQNIFPFTNTIKNRIRQDFDWSKFWNKMSERNFIQTYSEADWEALGNLALSSCRESDLESFYLSLLTCNEKNEYKFTGLIIKQTLRLMGHCATVPSSLVTESLVNQIKLFTRTIGQNLAPRQTLILFFKFLDKYSEVSKSGNTLQIKNLYTADWEAWANQIKKSNDLSLTLSFTKTYFKFFPLNRQFVKIFLNDLDQSFTKSKEIIDLMELHEVYQYLDAIYTNDSNG
ncbi:MAG: hypothetical protein WCG27_10015, partial [Pseudomonadota bacterium]